MNINERLKSYRRKKHKEQMTESIKNAVRNIFSSNPNDTAVESTKEEEVKLCKQSQEIQDEENVPSYDNVPESKNLDQSDKVNSVPIQFLIQIVKL
ncbi:uncharacterized protein LOC109851845 isoform X2 [Pseudomyrmex gracilis]|uniref:uncharacterized protein LOC109851845 isoform X2 n=1 Tax=Pseudomyrmex gracilis TaxID=219809 RepID=UPI000995ACD8|nr:uncharacterized protein LOC109851845 isoform X2 [Pseudomyrmex gracilis]